MPAISTSPGGGLVTNAVLVFHLEVIGSIPAASIIFSAGLTILALLSSSWTRNILYSMLLAGIFPAQQTQKKLVECSEIASSIVQTHKTPAKPITISLLGYSKEKLNSMGM